MRNILSHSLLGFFHFVSLVVARAFLVFGGCLLHHISPSLFFFLFLCFFLSLALFKRILFRMTPSPDTKVGHAPILAGNSILNERKEKESRRFVQNSPSLQREILTTTFAGWDEREREREGRGKGGQNENGCVAICQCPMNTSLSHRVSVLFCR